MKLHTAKLLTILSEYQFFDWEHQKNNKHRIMIGLPENMLIIKDFINHLVLTQSRIHIQT